MGGVICAVVSGSPHPPTALAILVLGKLAALYLVDVCPVRASDDTKARIGVVDKGRRVSRAWVVRDD